MGFFIFLLALRLKEKPSFLVVMYAHRRFIVAIVAQMHLEAVLFADFPSCTTEDMVFFQPDGRTAQEAAAFILQDAHSHWLTSFRSSSGVMVSIPCALQS